jgi:hypothetical protein
MKKFITEEAVRDLNSWTGSRRSWVGRPLGKNDELGLGEGQVGLQTGNPVVGTFNEVMI